MPCAGTPYNDHSHERIGRYHSNTEFAALMRPMMPVMLPYKGIRFPE
jgi:hypothetical protein